MKQKKLLSCYACLLYTSVVLLTPLSIFVARFIATHTYSMFKVQSETRAEMMSLVEELVGNEHLVRAFGYESRAEARFDKINTELQKCGVRAVFFSSITNPCTRFVNALVYAAVGVLGAFVAIGGGITVGQLTVFLNYANQYTKPFNDISDVMTELQNALACAQRVFDLIDETPIVPDAVSYTHLDVYKRQVQGTPGIRRQLALRPDQALLELDEICYSRTCRPVLCCQTCYTDFFDFAIVRKLV